MEKMLKYIVRDVENIQFDNQLEDVIVVLDIVGKDKVKVVDIIGMYKYQFLDDGSFEIGSIVDFKDPERLDDYKTIIIYGTNQIYSPTHEEIAKRWGSNGILKFVRTPFKSVGEARALLCDNNIKYGRSAVHVTSDFIGVAGFAEFVGECYGEGGTPPVCFFVDANNNVHSFNR